MSPESVSPIDQAGGRDFGPSRRRRRNREAALHTIILRLRRSARRRRIRAITRLRLIQAAHPGITQIDLTMMRRAIELAGRAAAMDEVPIGAVVYRGEEIIAEAHNNREASRDPVGHAELLAVSEAGRIIRDWRLNDCSLAVTLEPCPMCAGALVNARVGRLIYGASDPKAGACETLYRITDDTRLNHRVEVFSGVLADECAELLRSFFRRRREARKTSRRRRSA